MLESYFGCERAQVAYFVVMVTQLLQRSRNTLSSLVLPSFRAYLGGDRCQSSVTAGKSVT